MLLKWIDKLNKKYDYIGCLPIMCKGPEFLDIVFLPENVKKKALSGIEEYERSSKNKDKFLLECLQSIKNVLEFDENNKREEEGKNLKKIL